VSRPLALAIEPGSKEDSEWACPHIGHQQPRVRSDPFDAFAVAVDSTDETGDCGAVWISRIQRIATAEGPRGEDSTDQVGMVSVDAGIDDRDGHRLEPRHCRRTADRREIRLRRPGSARGGLRDGGRSGKRQRDDGVRRE
jgi:hypothetical protein